MFAIFETGGKQYKVQQDDVELIEKIEASEKDEIIFDKVLAYSDDENVVFGQPYVEGAYVHARVLTQGKDKKIIVFKHKAKKGYKRTQGHRQPHTRIRIEKLVFPGDPDEASLEEDVDVDTNEQEVASIEDEGANEQE